MSIKFSDTLDYATLDFSPWDAILTDQFYISAWAKLPNTSTHHFVLGIGEGARTGALERHGCRLYNNGTVYAQSVNQPGAVWHAAQKGTFPTNTWFHGLWRFGANGADRQCYLNGTSGTAQTTAHQNDADFGGIWFGDYAGNDYGMTEPIAEVGVWKGTTLTQDEIDALAAGISCQHIQPAKLVHYLPCLGTLHDARRPISAISGTVIAVADHPRIYY